MPDETQNGLVPAEGEPDTDMQELSDPDARLKRVEHRKKIEAEKFGNAEDDSNDEISSIFTMDCLNANEFGDGEMFKAFFRNVFVYNKSMGEWMRHCVHFWELDTMNSAMAAVEKVVERYLQEVISISNKIRNLKDKDPNESRLKQERKLLLRRSDALRSVRRRSNCLTFAHTTKNPLAIKGDEVDCKPYLLACGNGVIDLKTGGVNHGRAEDYLLKHTDIEWQGLDEPCPLWEKTLLEIADEDIELVEFEQRLYGYSMSGGNPERCFVVLDGSGWNGKTLKTRVIGYVLKDFVGPIQSELLLSQGRLRSSSAPSPDIMALRGLRMAFASETDDGAKFSASKVKWLTGNDELIGRYPHDKLPVKFEPTHTLFLLTNNKPHAPGGDYAFWKRMLLIPHKLSFVERPIADNERKVDKYLFEKLKAEASGILAWLVKGCLLWQRDGLNPPACVREATAEYQKDEDIIGQFIDECCLVQEGITVGASNLYNAFDEWYTSNIGKYPPKQKTFGTWMTKRFRRERGKAYFYIGIGLLQID